MSPSSKSNKKISNTGENRGRPKIVQKSIFARAQPQNPVGILQCSPDPLSGGKGLPSPPHEPHPAPAIHVKRC